MPQKTTDIGPIGDRLIARNLIEPADLDRALQLQAGVGGRIGAILIRLGAVSEDTLLPVLAEQLGCPLLEETRLPARAEAMLEAIAAAAIPPQWFIEQNAVLWRAESGALVCASREPNNSLLRETLDAKFPAEPIQWCLLRTRDQERLLELLRPSARQAVSDDVAHLREMAEEAPVIELVNNLLAQAADENASDIHIEPQETEFVVRFRVDGVLQLRARMPRGQFEAVASRVKLISGLDIAERRLPQDGRISVRASGAEMDVRVSVIPAALGESIVLRLLPKNRADFSLERLGLEADHLRDLTRWIREPHGIVLVTGPTGSGKSTTLYAALGLLNDGVSKIVTVEDPVEYRMRGITQIQTLAEIDYDFARALRAILRHDPDIIMIGEIRDRETAEIAVQSALTGHMVFSTLHTNDAVSAFTRLVDMGIEPFLVASAIRAVEAQRLVRRLCPECSRPAAAGAGNEAMVAELGLRFGALLDAASDWRQPAGCAACRQTGYRGRLGIYEFVEVNPQMQEAILRRASAGELAAIARRQGARSLREDGLLKARRGLTSVEEVLRVTGLADPEDEERGV